MAVEFVDFAKQTAERQSAQSDAERKQFELEAEKETYKAGKAEAAGIYDILKGYAGEQAPKQGTPPSVGGAAPSAPKGFVGPNGQPAPSFMAGAQAEKDAKESQEPKPTGLKDIMAQEKQASDGYMKQAQLLNKLMLNAAKNNNPKAALDYRKQLDGLQDTMADSQEKQLKLAQTQYETSAQLGQAFIDNPTDEQWYSGVREALRLGLPGAEQLLTVPPEKREAVAKAAIGQGLTANQSAKAHAEAQKVVLKQEAENAREKHRQHRDDINDQKLALQRGHIELDDKLKQEKYTESQKKDSIDSANKVVNADEKYLANLEKERKDVQDDLETVEKGTQFGMTEKEMADKKVSLTKDIAKLDSDIALAKSDAAKSRAQLHSLQGVKPVDAIHPTTGAKRSVHLEKLTPESKAWLDAAKKANPGMTQAEILGHGLDSGDIVEQKSKAN